MHLQQQKLDANDDDNIEPAKEKKQNQQHIETYTCVLEMVDTYQGIQWWHYCLTGTGSHCEDGNQDEFLWMVLCFVVLVEKFKKN